MMRQRLRAEKDNKGNRKKGNINQLRPWRSKRTRIERKVKVLNVCTGMLSALLQAQQEDAGQRKRSTSKTRGQQNKNDVTGRIGVERNIVQLQNTAVWS